MLVIRGVNVFPSQIENVLLNVDGVEPHYLIVVDRKNTFSSDALEILVEISPTVVEAKAELARRSATGSLYAPVN